MIVSIRQGDVMRFYNSSKWRKLRLKIIEKYNYECQHCKREGKVGKAEFVHHIKHLKDYPELGLHEPNLIPLCFYHHELEHPERAFKGNKPDISKRPKNFEERW